MIRPATPKDRSRVVELLADSHVGAGFDTPAGATGFTFPFDPAYAERLFLSHLRGRNLAIVHDVDGTAQGVLLATASEHPFGPVWLARETLWWIDPAHRGGTAAPRMLDAYEKWAAAQGCRFVGMAGMGDDPTVAKLYQRRGYARAETHFLKPLVSAA
jgi:GNAT superfamily N-acetyltransferase